MMMRCALTHLKNSSKSLLAATTPAPRNPSPSYFIPFAKYSAGNDDERKSNKPYSDPKHILHNQPSGNSFAFLAATHGVLAATCFIAPTSIAAMLFPPAASALAHGLQSQTLVQLLGCSLAGGSLTSLALKTAADNHQLGSSVSQRLQLGLMAFSSSSIILHALYSPAINFESLLLGAAAMGATFFIPFQSYRCATGNIPSAIDATKRYLGAVPDHFRIANLDSAVYAGLTPVLAIAGISYLIFPGSTLAATLGYVKDVSSFFFWQNIGCGLATLLPTMTYSLKRISDEKRLDSSLAKILNLGVLACAVGHLTVLWPLVGADVGGPWLKWVVGAWAYAAVAGAFGLIAPRAGGGAAK